jgi:hypothetical protein
MTFLRTLSVLQFMCQASDPVLYWSVFHDTPRRARGKDLPQHSQSLPDYVFGLNIIGVTRRLL